MNKRKLFKRILVSPAILLILIITYAHGMIVHFIKFMSYGGEWVTYEEKDPQVTLGKIYKSVNKN